MEHNDSLQLLDNNDLSLKLNAIFDLMDKAEVNTMLVSANANLFYLTGRVYSGWAYLTAANRSVYHFVKRPIHLKGEGVYIVRKPENILEIIERDNLPRPERMLMELGVTPYATIMRLSKAMGVQPAGDATSIMRAARAVKTPAEIEKIKASGVKHEYVYRHVPQLYRPGMTDIDFHIEIEHQLRLEGCLGQFRVSGQDMEIHMANILTGDNADAPSPYDFAMGGAGAHPSLPVGADNTLIERGMTVMVDANGNFNGYMTDMTRTFTLGPVNELAARAHQVSIDICDRIQEAARPGVEARELYDISAQMAQEAGLEKYFMGHRQHAAFVGHGVGIEINEAPVLAPRSRDIIAVGNVFALEPKFVIPGVGAVGIENTYIVLEDKTICATNAPTQLISLD